MSSRRAARAWAAAASRCAIRIAALSLFAGAAGGAEMPVTVQNDFLRIGLRPDARVVWFQDRQTRADYLGNAEGTPIASVKQGGREHPATSAAWSEGRLTLAFGESGVSVALAVSDRGPYSVVEVVSATGDGIEELAFIDIPLKLRGTPDEQFAACALALNLRTKVTALPGATHRLRASCYPRFGLVGAKAAILACPSSKLRAVMQQVVSEAGELPRSSLGGPWALDEPVNRRSYLFNFGGLTEQTVDEWIALARNLGIDQIDFHGGGSFRFGDCRPNPEWYPGGRASLKAVIDRLHAAGILAGLHTYAFFIDKSCPWVTPSPDPRLAKDATFTLANALGADEAEVRVVESTEKMSATTGFFVRNSVTLQIDDELIVYGGVSAEPPFAFTGCQRGAYGTRAAPHSAGAMVHHLKECFGLFAPDGDSTLLEEVAAASADFYNECGFDMIYLDALDGEDVLGGPENGWHYGSKFVFELVRRLKKPAIMEMSTFHHHLWYVRSRMGAWDHPARSHKRFIDIHCEANKACERMFLPAHLGWWRIIADADPRMESTFSDDIEYLCCKCAAYDCGLSPQGFTPETYAGSHNLRRLGDIIRRYERLRAEGFFDESTRAKLREPGAEFTLVEGPDGPRLRSMRCDKHKVELCDPRTRTWTVENRFGAQKAKLRIEALMSAGQYDAPDNVVLVDPARADEVAQRSSAAGVTFQLAASEVKTASGEPTLRYRASLDARGHPTDGRREDTYSGTEHGVREVGAPAASWTSAEKVFSPTIDISGHRAMGVWIHGDGKDELLNFQMRSPHHVSGGIADHYVRVDFEGWRYFELVEPEGERVDEHIWPYANYVYGIYRELVDPARVHSVGIWFNDLPAHGEANCLIGPVKGVPLVQARWANPSVTIGGRSITFPVKMESGHYLEYLSEGDCRLYDARGEPLADVTPEGEAPVLSEGPNTVAFDCEAPQGVYARARVTVIAQED